jgi:hypothetical protein
MRLHVESRARSAGAFVHFVVLAAKLRVPPRDDDAAYGSHAQIVLKNRSAERARTYRRTSRPSSAVAIFLRPAYTLSPQDGRHQEPS